VKTKKQITGFSVALLAVFSAHAQDTSFQNLNFEDANPVLVPGSPYYPYFATVASALPYWTVSYGSVQPTGIFYDDVSLGADAVSLIGADAPPQLDISPIDGNYSVLLQGIVPGTEVSISQTGLIPSGMQSLLFEAAFPLEMQGPMELLVGSQVVPFSAVGSGANYTLYGANISTWAGDPEELTFSAIGGSYNNWSSMTFPFPQTPSCPNQALHR
jgi:hypothetical protein